MTGSTIRTETILDLLVAGKRESLEAQLLSEPIADLKSRARLAGPTIALAPVLQGQHVQLIAEIKQASPAAGVLESDFEPVARARTYAEAGAAAISILTEERRFLGSMEHLSRVHDALIDRLGSKRPPLLRKDFLFDPYHLYEARAGGADAVLLIVAMLEQPALVGLLELADELGLSVLVEVHDEEQTERALKASAELIGVNNRDLRSFETSLSVTERLRPMIPDGPVVVSESGIHSEGDIQRLAACRIDAVLVGEALMRSGDVAGTVRTFTGVERLQQNKTMRSGRA